MKPKRKFTFEEVCKIHWLSRVLGGLQERKAGKGEQKKVRDKLREIGFYISDSRRWKK